MTATFAELGLSEQTLKAITELGYEEPTPVQAQTIQILLEGGDVIAQAQTGTGKTAAFALPIIEKIDVGLAAPQALVLTPTRELAVQVAEAFHSYSKGRQVAVLPVYGGQPIDRQLRALKQGVQVVVGTPGRVLDHIGRGTLRLNQVKMIALDEADEMLDMGFIEDIESILKEIPAERQMCLFSATMPTQISNLAKRYMRDPQRITIKAEQMAVPLTRQTYYEVGKRDKFEVLVRILDYERPTSAIIFCRTKLEVDNLGQRLTARAYSAETIHGDLNQAQRDRVMGRFRAERVELLIATDVAARGLDIEHISHVINYDIPLDPESYVHRIGRTGRAGRSGAAITLLTTRERRLWQLIEKTSGAQIQRMRIPTIADVMERRREEFKETIRETLSQGGLEAYAVMVEELADENNSTEIAAAAFKLLLDMPQDTEDRIGDTEEFEEDRDRQPRRRPRERDREEEDWDRVPRRRPQREENEFGQERGMTQLYLNVGWNDGVRPGDIVGAIANEADIQGRSIGAIDIFDGFTLVDVPESQAQKVIQALRGVWIRNQKIMPSLNRADIEKTVAFQKDKKDTRSETRPDPRSESRFDPRREVDVDRPYQRDRPINSQRERAETPTREKPTAPRRERTVASQQDKVEAFFKEKVAATRKEKPAAAPKEAAKSLKKDEIKPATKTGRKIARKDEPKTTRKRTKSKE